MGEHNGAILKPILATLIAALSYVSNSLGSLFWIYIFLTCCDFISGVMAAYITGELNSSIGRKGIIRKFGTFIVIICAVFIDYFALHYGVNTSSFLYASVCSWYITMDSISIFENADRMGIPIPEWMKKGLKIAKPSSKIKTSL